MAYPKQGSKIPNVQKVVDWVLVKKAMVKFQGAEDALSISANVMEKYDFEKYPIVKGDTVEVGIIKDEVTFIRKAKADSTPSQPQAQSAPVAEASVSQVSGDKQTLTVLGVFKKDGDVSIKFKEGKINNKAWVKLSSALCQKEPASIGFVANNQVNVTLTDGVITAVDVVASEQPKETKKEETSSTYSRKSSYRDEESMDKRTASMNATAIVSAIINSGDVTDVNTVKQVLSELTKSSYNDITTL